MQHFAPVFLQVSTFFFIFFISIKLLIFCFLRKQKIKSEKCRPHYGAKADAKGKNAAYMYNGCIDNYCLSN
jgi:hypothetical protein